jgi:hypothetical protein
VKRRQALKSVRITIFDCYARQALPCNFGKPWRIFYSKEVQNLHSYAWKKIHEKVTERKKIRQNARLNEVLAIGHLKKEAARCGTAPSLISLLLFI